ncbi:MAG TPA: hypothetical protein VGM88_09320 [Kofleriaceae bacterium]|jgi:hypothetical protein
MPVSPTSRYYGLAAGALRPLPDQSNVGGYKHRVTALENIEYLAWRYFGHSEDYWRILDANPTRFPLDLKPSEQLLVPVGADVGLVLRTRKF